MYNVFYNILPIFLIALLGSILRRKWLTSDEFWHGLEKLSFYILLPALLFRYSVKIDLGSLAFVKLIIALIISTLIISVILIIYQTRKPYNNIQFTSIFQGATRFNNYIFFALSAALFGSDGLIIVSAISPYLIILTNITSVMSFSYYIPKGERLTKRKSLILMIKSIIGNPCVSASIFGIIFNYLELPMNLGIENTLHNLANSALTIGILIVGAGIKFRLDMSHFNQLLFTSSVKLIAMPIVTFIILWFMNITGTEKSIGILFSCLPCSSSSYILSKQLGGDPDTMLATITLTTIFSFISLSVLIYILG